MRQFDMTHGDDTPSGRWTPQPGTARSALRHRNFRILWSGVLVSNIGTWMQNVLLGAFGWTLTRSAFFVALLFFAQLGPVLVLAPVGGLLADDFSRRKVVIATQIPQLIAAVVLAVLALHGVPKPAVVALLVLVIGIFNALSMPAVLASLPGAVPRVDIDGAVSLTTLQMNLSRVLGPALGAVLFAWTNASTVFVVNAATYAVLIVAFSVSQLAPHPPKGTDLWLRRLTGGVRMLRTDATVRRVLAMMAAFSLGCLPFLGLLPAIAAKRFGMDPKSVAYGLLVASLGLGAVLGSLAVGTVLARVSRQRVATVGFVGFALAMSGIVFVTSAPLAYPLVGILGVTYFSTVTALSNILQRDLSEEVRGRVTALWMMSFGGTVPIGVLFFGAVAQEFGVVVVLVVATVCAGALAAVAGTRLRAAS